MVQGNVRGVHAGSGAHTSWVPGEKPNITRKTSLPSCPCPGQQAALEVAYKQELREAFGVEFNRLFCLNNMPIKRFADYLQVGRGEGQSVAGLGLMEGGAMWSRANI